MIRPRRSTDLTPAVLALLALAACGGGSPTHPTTPPATTPTGVTTLDVVSGETGQPVAGATVNVGGRVYTSDAGGQVALQEPGRPGALVDILASGFLDRQTLVRTGVTRYTLWPRTSPTGVDEMFTGTIVYTGGDSDFAARPLLRLRAGTTSVLIAPDATLQADGPAMAAHAAAVAEISDAAGGSVSYLLAPPGTSAGVAFSTKLDPADDLCKEGTARGYTSLSVRASEIVGGSIVYCLRDAARSSTVTHELGHTYGLWHSPNSRELMGVPYSRRRATGFSVRESLVMALMMQRRGGNRFPDNDREAAASAWSGHLTIACE